MAAEIEAEVFGSSFGESAENLRGYYGSHIDQTAFVLVGREMWSGMMRVGLPGPRQSLSVEDALVRRSASTSRHRAGAPTRRGPAGPAGRADRRRPPPGTATRRIFGPLLVGADRARPRSTRARTSWPWPTPALVEAIAGRRSAGHRAPACTRTTDASATAVTSAPCEGLPELARRAWRPPDRPLDGWVRVDAGPCTLRNATTLSRVCVRQGAQVEPRSHPRQPTRCPGPVRR